MNVLETMRSILSECELLDAFNGCHVDYTEPNVGTCGLFSNGATKVRETICGKQYYHIAFQLYASCDAFEDFNRLQNSNFLLELTYYLNGLKDIAIVEKVGLTSRQGKITKITASNALLFNLITNDLNDGVQYQLQINVDYEINGED